MHLWLQLFSFSLKSTMLVLDIIICSFFTWALALGLPFDKLIGVNSWWFLYNAAFYRKMKQSLGSFFMTFYRVLFVKRPGMKLIRRKKIIKQLFCLEGIVTVFLLGGINLSWTLRWYILILYALHMYKKESFNKFLEIPNTVLMPLLAALK